MSGVKRGVEITYFGLKRCHSVERRAVYSRLNSPSYLPNVPPHPFALSYTLPVTQALEKLRDLFFCFSFLGSCNVRGEFVPPRAKEHRFKLGGLDQFNSITKQLTIKTKKVAQFIPFVAKLTQRQSHVWKQLREWAIQRRTGQFWLLWRRRG